MGREGDTEGDENGSTADAEAGGVLAEDVEMLEKEVSEIHDIIGSMSDSFEDRQREVEGQVSDHGDRLDELGAAIEEIASVQVQLLEAMGGGVEYDHVDVENDEEEVSVVDAVEAYDPTEEFE